MSQDAFGLRVGVYGLTVRGDAAGKSILLCRLAEHVPWGGHWTLPGGGMDFGEQPVDTLHREVGEETGLRIVGAPRLLFSRSHVRPENRWMSVQIVYAAALEPGRPQVVEEDGSTAAVEWVPLDGIDAIPTVGLVDAALAWWNEHEPENAPS